MTLNGDMKVKKETRKRLKKKAVDKGKTYDEMINYLIDVLEGKESF